MLKRQTRFLALLLALVTALSLAAPVRAEAAALKQGSSGREVKQLQQNLIGLGFLEGNADGAYGGMTQSAVKAFQAEFGLAPDGNAGEATQAAVRNAVVRLQVELQRAGYAPGAADGNFGSKTEKALEKYQKNHELQVTGCADQATWSSLDQNSAGIQGGASARTAAQVKQLQQALIGLGYLQGTADGAYGSMTREAVRQYQKAYGLGADGSAGPDTMTSLKNTVTALQSDLSRRGFYSGTVDSSFGSGTRAAVKAYQQAVGLDQTGVAGSRTMEKLCGYALGGSEAQVQGPWKTWIDSLYQDGDYREIIYRSGGKKSTTVEKSGCAGVALAMGLNALLETGKYNGQNVMQWFADNGYYYGNGTYQEGIWKYPRKLGLKSAYCDTAKDLIDHLKKDRLAVALIKDKTGDEFFTYAESRGHFILISGYREQNGVDQIFVNNPLSWKSSKWFDVEDLMDNACNDWQGYENSFVVIYK